MSRKDTARTPGQIVARLLLVLYGLLMIWLLFGQRLHADFGGGERINLQPFATLRLYIRILLESGDGGLVRHAFINLAGNVLMFVPLGIFLPVIWKRLRNFWRFLLLSTVLILLIEVTQYVTGLGSCDVDDFILNLPGMLLGWYGHKIFLKKQR